MPKSVTPIVLNETDVITLKSIISGDIAAGAAVQKRANAILLLSEGKRIKDTAKEIGMRENSVTEIRRRFIANGMSSLMDKRRSGRPVTKMAAGDVEIKVGDIISSAFSGGTPIPSVKDIAKSLNAREQVVRDVLKRKGLIQERKRCWEFPVFGTPEAKTIDVCGMFLSSCQQAILCRACNPDLTVSSGESSVITNNSAVASALNESATQNGFADLAHALESFLSAAGTRPTGKADALEFVKNLYAEFTTDGHMDYHLFICGNPLAENSRSMLPGITVHTEPDIPAWIAMAESIFSILCEKEPGLSKRIAAGISAYVRQPSGSKAAFQWKKGKQSPDICKESGESMNMQKDGTAKPAGTIEIEARVMSDDGNWITYTAKGTSSVKQGQFDMTDVNAYLNSFDKIEQAIARVSHDAARGINEAYAADLVKKKVPTKKSQPK